MTNQLQSFLMKEKQTNKKQSEILKLKTSFSQSGKGIF